MMEIKIDSSKYRIILGSAILGIDRMVFEPSDCFWNVWTGLPKTKTAKMRMKFNERQRKTNSRKCWN